MSGTSGQDARDVSGRALRSGSVIVGSALPALLGVGFSWMASSESRFPDVPLIAVVFFGVAALGAWLAGVPRLARTGLGLIIGAVVGAALAIVLPTWTVEF